MLSYDVLKEEVIKLFDISYIWKVKLPRRDGHDAPSFQIRYILNRCIKSQHNYPDSSKIGYPLNLAGQSSLCTHFESCWLFSLRRWLEAMQ